MPKILIVSPKGDGLWYSLIFQKEGHTVDCYLEEKRFKGTLKGLIPPLLDRLPSIKPYDLVVFDSDGLGELADYTRSVVPTVGSSSLADRLEEDRLYGLEVMEQAGIKVPEWEVFDKPEKGIAWLERTHKRTVFKPIGDVPGDDKSTTYVATDEKDMIAFMERVFTKAKISSFVLQEVVDGGTEAAVGGWFNGEDWLVVDHNIEEKKLMPGDIGPNTGCASMLMWLPARPTPMFQQGIDKIKPYLQEMNYVGPIDLNTICTEGTAYGIEWTPRFGYEGTCNLTRLIGVPFSELLHACATRSGLPMAEPVAKFCASIRISVPPYPNADKAKKPVIVPILGIDPTHPEDCFLADVQAGEAEGELQTTGTYNSVGAPLGVGASIEEAFEECQHYIKRLKIPDLMWRNDVCESTTKKYNRLQRQGWLRPLG